MKNPLLLIDTKVVQLYQRIPRVLVHIAAIATMFAAIFATMEANPFAGETVAPVDMIMEFPGWDSVGAEPVVRNKEHGDSIDAAIPTWFQMRDQLHRGEWPIWNLNSSGGVPGGVNLISEMWTPFFWPFFLIEDPGLGFYWGMALKLIMASLGMYLLIHLFSSPLVAAFAGYVFAFSSFHIAWFYVCPPSTSLWFPWLFLCGYHYLNSNRMKWLLGVTAFSTLIVMAGFPATGAHGFMAFCFFLGLVLLTRQKVNLKGVLDGAKIMLAIFWGFAISALPLVIFGEHMLTNLGSRRKGFTIFKPEDLRMFWDPFLYGIQKEKLVFMGQLPLILVGCIAVFIMMAIIPRLGPRLRQALNFEKPFWPLALAAVSLFVLATGVSFGLFNHDLIRMIPTFSSNGWHRALSITNLALALSAGVGLHLGVRLLTKTRLTIAVPILFVLLFAQQWQAQTEVFRNFNAALPAGWFYPKTPSLTYISDRVTPLQYTIADDAFFTGGTIGAYGIPEWFTHEFRNKKTARLLEKLVTNPWESATSSNIHADKIHLDSPYMDALGVRHLVVKSKFKDLLAERAAKARFPWRAVELEPGLTVFERMEPQETRAYWISSLDQSPQDITFDEGFEVNIASMNKIEVKVPDLGPGWVVLPLRHDNDWKAQFGQRDVQISSYLDILPAIKVPGAGTIVYQYSSPFFFAGLGVSLVSLVAWIVCFSFVTWPPRWAGARRESGQSSTGLLATRSAASDL